ncbi:hypothetical protein M1N18_00870 [Dehalococcoidales bacterium]|nr:hypothetical protein [Dehalococcoidales bacterium]
MKWLKILSTVIVALFVILIGVTIVVENKITDARQRGHSEGHAQGYAAGYQEGMEKGYTEGMEKGYESGYRTGFDEGIGTNYLVRNPTYKEVEELLAEYKQNREPISEPGQVDWAEDLNNYAETKGIRAAWVWVSTTERRWANHLVAFETVDEGLIFYDFFFRTHDVEPPKRWELVFEEVEPEVGEMYRDYPVTKITLIW